MKYEIEITKSPTADTRTCDFTKVSLETLLRSSFNHIRDVRKAMMYFSSKILEAGDSHDHTKISGIREFHSDFVGGFKTQDWYAMHKAVERHHINYPDGVRADIDLIDVLEYVADIVMAGMARTGSIFPAEIPNEVLQLALKNTVEKLKAVVKVVG